MQSETKNEREYTARTCGTSQSTNRQKQETGTMICTDCINICVIACTVHAMRVYHGSKISANLLIFRV